MYWWVFYICTHRYTQTLHIGRLRHRHLFRWGTFPFTHTVSATALCLRGVMSGELLLLLTQGLFAWAFTASPRPSATAVRQESAGEEQRLSFPQEALLHTFIQKKKDPQKDTCYTLFASREKNTNTPFTFLSKRIGHTHIIVLSLQ